MDYEVRRCVKSAAATAALAVALLAFAGCSTAPQIKRAGQSEIFSLSSKTSTEQKVMVRPVDEAIIRWERKPLDSPQLGDPIRYTDDPISIVLETVHLERLPSTLTGSHDVVVFAEIWENGAASNMKPLVTVVQTSEHQTIPGSLNFYDGIAYGPTRYKGYPLKLKLTVLLLQKQRAENQAQTASLINNFAIAVAPQFSPVASIATGFLRDILRSQPDVIAFDYTMTFLSDESDGFLPLINEANPRIGSVDPNRVKNMEIQKVKEELETWQNQSGVELIPRAHFSKIDEAAFRNALRQVDAIKSFYAGSPKGSVSVEKYSTLRYGRFAMIQTDHSESAHEFTSKRLPELEYHRGKLWFGTNSLKANYIVLRIDPTQRPQDDVVMRAVADASESLMSSLTQSSQDVKQSSDEILTRLQRLKTDIWKNQIEERARKLAKANPSDKDSFNRAFDASIEQLSSTLPENQRSDFRDAATVIKERWSFKYDGQKPQTISGNE